MLLFFFYITNWWCLSLIILEKKKVSCLLPCPEELKGTQISASPAEVVCPAAANEDAADWIHFRNPALLQQLLLERKVVTCTAQEGRNPECTKIGFSFGLLAQRKNNTEEPGPLSWLGAGSPWNTHGGSAMDQQQAQVTEGKFWLYGREECFQHEGNQILEQGPKQLWDFHLWGYSTLPWGPLTCTAGPGDSQRSLPTSAILVSQVYPHHLPFWHRGQLYTVPRTKFYRSRTAHLS